MQKKGALKLKKRLHIILLKEALFGEKRHLDFNLLSF